MTSQIDITEHSNIAFTRSRIHPIQLFSLLFWLPFLLVMISLLPGTAGNWFRFVIMAVAVCGMALASRFWKCWRVRRRGGLAPITITSEQVILPMNALSLRTARVALENIRSAVIVGRGWRARLLIDAGRRRYSFPRGCFAEPDPLSQLRSALRAGLGALPDGARLVAGMDVRHAAGDDVGGVRPVATWCIVGLVAIAFGVQTLCMNHPTPLGLLELGADAPLLLWQGEWFRLITFNLLHLSPGHMFENALWLLVFGCLVERLVGFRRCMIIVLATGIASGVASAGGGELFKGHLYSVGASGVVFGLMGTLGVITWRLDPILPGGLRIARVWWVLIAVGAIFGLVMTSKVDVFGHGGGLLTGLTLGALLCRGCKTIHDLRRPTALTSAACVVLLLTWGGAILADGLHATSISARSADRLAVAQGLLAAGHDFPPAFQNEVAWAIATDADAPLAALEQGAELAARAVATETRARPDGLGIAAYGDTLASLDFRLGNAAQAVARELPLLGRDRQSYVHFALFLDRQMREQGIQILGDTGPPAPTVVSSNGVLRLGLVEPMAAGGRAYAVVRQHGALAGLLVFQILPGFSGQQVLPLPWAHGAPSIEAPPALWTDPDTEITIALFDRRGCFCKTPSMGPQFTPVTLDGGLPLWTARR